MCFILLIVGFGRFQPVCSPNQEKNLVEYLKEQEKHLYGSTTKELRTLVYQLAEKNSIEHPFQHGMAGRNWCKAFLKRHAKDLTIRKP